MLALQYTYSAACPHLLWTAVIIKKKARQHIYPTGINLVQNVCLRFKVIFGISLEHILKAAIDARKIEIMLGDVAAIWDLGRSLRYLHV